MFLLENTMSQKKSEDLGIKIGSKDEVMWSELKTKTEQYLESVRKELIVQTAILALAEDKIAEEQKKNPQKKEVPLGVG